jgi:hypothetical protein
MKKAGLMLAGVASLLAIVASSATGATPQKTLRMLDIAATSTPAFDVGHGAPRAGDRVFLVDDLYAWNGATKGARLGHSESTMTFMTKMGAQGATVSISGELFVPGGAFLVEGLGHVGSGPSHFTLPIVGGTGTYAGARGTLQLDDLSGHRSPNTVQLLPS